MRRIFRMLLTKGAQIYILVQLPEPLDIENKDQKTAAEFCDSIGKPRRISEITKERLRRSAQKALADHGDAVKDAGFRVFKLDTSNIRAWNPNRDNLAGTLYDHLEHVVEGRCEGDVLYELLLKLGLDLCVPIQKRGIAGKTVHSIGNGVLMACLADQITEADAEALALGLIEWRKEQGTAGDSTAVFRDSAFGE